MILVRQSARKTAAFCFRLTCLVIIAAGSVANGLSRETSAAPHNVSSLMIESNSFVRAQVSASTFQDSCTNIRIENDTLTADCQRRNGRYRTSSIRIRGIHNDDGRLTYLRNSRGASTFQDSCRNIRVQGNRLNARCERANGSFVRSSIIIRGVQNDDGRLEYHRN